MITERGDAGGILTHAKTRRFCTPDSREPNAGARTAGGEAALGGSVEPDLTIDGFENLHPDGIAPAKMRFACLVIAYEGAKVLRESLPLLCAAGWDVFVHLDQKADLCAYRSDLAEAAPLCRFVERRLRVFWGGYSMMLAQFNLIDAARSACKYDKYVLISDDAFPIYPPAALAEILSRPFDFIMVNRQKHGSEFDQRYRDFFFYDHPATSPRIRYLYSPRIDDAFIAKTMELAHLRRIGKKPIDVYHGSQFWCLTARTLEAILEICRADDHLCRSFEFSSLSDELMFQSIVGNYLRDVKPVGGPMFADFSRGHGPLLYSSFEQLPASVHATNTFIRKIEPEAGAFLSALRSKLEAGRTIFGSQPQKNPLDAPVGYQDGRPVYVVKLTAPTTIDGLPASSPKMWHAPEKTGETGYRWTASPTVEWAVRRPSELPCRIRLVVPVLMWILPDFRQQCCFSVAGRHIDVTLHGNDIVAEFDVTERLDDLRIVLSTPPPRSPAELSGTRDERRLGLAVAIEAA